MSECQYCTSRRQLLGMGIAGGIALSLPGLALARTGSLHHFSGRVLVDGKPARRGTLVAPSSKVETGVDSITTFVIGNNAFTLRSGTQVQFTRHQTGLSGFRLLTGALIGVFGPGPKKLITNTATIGIRGTGVYFETREQSSYICLCYGGIDLNANSVPGTPQTVTATHHEGRVVTAEGNISPEPMVNHTDDELVLLEGLVGRKPPFAA